MNIAIFSDAFPPLVTGVVTHVVDIIHDLHAKGHNLLVVAPQPKNETDEIPSIPGLKVHYVKSFASLVYPDFRFTPPLSLSVLQVTRDFKPDIIHFHTPGSLGWNAILYGKTYDVPLVGTFHVYIMEAEYLRMLNLHKVKLDNSKRIVNLGWSVCNMIYNQSDIVIAPSNFTKQDLLEHGLKKPIEVVSNGIHLPNAKAHQKLDTHYNLPKKYFVYFGRLSREKNIDLLMRAFASFVKEYPEVKLVLIGDGPARAELEELIKDLTISSNVILTGMLEHTKVIHSHLLRNALACVTASTSETQCLSVLECMALGLPVIAVRARALEEVIGTNGILCESGNVVEFSRALGSLYSDEGLQKTLRKKSLMVAKKHSINTTITKLEKIYTKLVEQYKSEKV